MLFGRPTVVVGSLLMWQGRVKGQCSPRILPPPPQALSQCEAPPTVGQQQLSHLSALFLLVFLCAKNHQKLGQVNSIDPSLINIPNSQYRLVFDMQKYLEHLEQQTPPVLVFLFKLWQISLSKFSSLTVH